MLAVLLLAGCGNDEPAAEPIDAVITVAASAFSVNNASGSETTATFTVNADWTISVSYEGDAQGWLSVTPQSGSAGEDIVITLKATAENTSDANRIAYVNIRYAGKTHRLTGTQTIGPNIDITARFDAEFAKILKERGYIPNAENIKLSDVKDIKEINVAMGSDEQRGNLTSLSGIEYFSALTYLACGRNRLTALDVSKNTALTYLNCDNNQLTALDISGCTALIRLDCDNNQLSTLDISKNTALDILSYNSNPGNGTVFPVTAWFDNSSVPSGFPKSGWDYNGNTISIDYIKGN